MVLRVLIAVTSLVAELQGMWDLSRSGIEPMSPALAGGFFTTEPPGKPLLLLLLPCHAACGISVPQPGIELRPGVLTTGTPGKSRCKSFLSYDLVSSCLYWWQLGDKSFHCKATISPCSMCNQMCISESQGQAKA